MFGLLLGIGTFIGKTIGDIQYSSESLINRSRAKRQGKETYLDCYGAERLVKNGRYVSRHTSDYGVHSDLVMTDSYGNILHNYSQVQRNKHERINIELAKRNGNTVYKKGQSNNELGDPNHQRKIYIDFDTKKELFLHSYNQYEFYRDTHTGEYIRLADECLKRNKSNNEDAKLIINKLNAEWNAKSSKDKQWIIKNEMRKFIDMDLSVPEAGYYNSYAYKQGLINITPEEYTRIIRQFN